MKQQWAEFFGTTKQRFDFWETKLADSIGSFTRGVVPVPAAPEGKVIKLISDAVPDGPPPVIIELHGYNGRPLKASDSLKEMLWPAYERSLANANGIWEVMALVLYSPPADEVGPDRRQLALPEPEPEAPLALKGPASDPQLLLGKQVRKKFGRRNFSGTIDKFHKKTGYHVTYEDGDEEDLSAVDAEAICVDGA